MAVTIPTFADLPAITPRAVTPQPALPQEDPGATAEIAFGGAVAKAGGALVDIAAYQQMTRNKMDRAMADANFFASAGSIDAQLKAETDPAKITALGQQYRQAAQTAAGSFSDPAARQLWLAQNEKHVAVGEKGAELRNLGIWRDSYKAGILSQADAALKTAEQSGDPRAFELAKERISGLADAAIGAGAMSAVQGEELRQHAGTRIERGLTNSRVEALSNYGLGMGPQMSGGMAVGGAIGRRVADTLRARGWSEPAIIGALNNSITESSLDPNATGGGGEKGLFQFHPASHLGPFRATYGGDMSPEAQTNYMADVVEKTMPGYSQISDVPQATAQFLRGFEKPKDQSDVQLNTRLANTRAARSIVSSGNGGSSSASAGGGSFDLAAGDSIAVGSIRHGGIGGHAVTLKGDPGAADADAAGGRNPQEALDYIAAHPDRFAGKTVLWSSGLMNAGISGAQAALPTVEKQIDALKAAGANPVLVGVDQGKFSQYNSALAAIADSKGVPFAGPLPTKDIHPSRDGYAQYAASAAKLIPVGPGGDAGAPAGKPEGLLQPGNIDLTKRPIVRNADGSISTVRSMSFNDGDQEVLIPTVAADGSRILSDQEAIDQYRKTGQFLGKFDTPEHATAYAENLHNAQAQFYGRGQQQQPASPNRTGLPPLTQQYERIFGAPGFTDAEREAAWNRAKAKYTAMEADAARAERIAAAQEKAALEQAITEYQRDAYSPQPTKTAQDIISDPRFNSDPKVREHMIAFINNPPGSGVPAPQSQAAAYDLVRRINLPEGDSQKITDLSQLTDPDTMRRLNKADFEFVVKQFNDIRAPGGERLAKVKDQLLQKYSGFITKSNPLSGDKDPVGDGRLFEYERYVDSRIDDYRKQGKDPNILFNPKSPDFVGDPSILRQFQPTMEESAKSKATWASGILQPLRPVGAAELPPIPSEEDMRRLFPETAPMPKTLTSRQPGAVAIPGGVEIPLRARVPGESPEEYLRRMGGQ